MVELATKDCPTCDTYGWDPVLEGNSVCPHCDGEGLVCAKCEGARCIWDSECVVELAVRWCRGEGFYWTPLQHQQHEMEKRTDVVLWHIEPGPNTHGASVYFYNKYFMEGVRSYGDHMFTNEADARHFAHRFALIFAYLTDQPIREARPEERP